MQHDATGELSSAIEAHKSQLASAWRGEVAGTYEGMAPVVSDRIVFVLTSGALVALDALNGHRMWSDKITALDEFYEKWQVKKLVVKPPTTTSKLKSRNRLRDARPEESSGDHLSV